MTEWLKKVKRLVVVEIGAGTDIPTVRNFGETLGCTLIRINPREPESDYANTIAIKLGGLEALQRIEEGEGRLYQAACREADSR